MIKKITPQHVNLQIASLEDGRWDVVHVAKQFCKAVEEQSCKPKDLTIELVEENVCTSDFVDPDFVLQFDDQEIALSGFLPWQIRLTEILQIGKLKHIHCTVFMSALKSFATKEQRLGK